MNPYDDIINLPHHVSDTRPRMPMRDRAAQFSPFAALSGYGDAIAETARPTDERIELDGSPLAVLDAKLRFLADILTEQPEITVTYFRQEKRKAGGEYLTVTGRLKKLDEYGRALTLLSGERIPFDDIFDISSERFRGIFDE